MCFNVLQIRSRGVLRILKKIYSFFSIRQKVQNNFVYVGEEGSSDVPWEQKMMKVDL